MVPPRYFIQMLFTECINTLHLFLVGEIAIIARDFKIVSAMKENDNDNLYLNSKNSC